MLSPGSLLNQDWYGNGEGRELISCLFTRNRQRLRTFGLLERPPLSAHIEEVSYKLFLSGKSGVGKTCTSAKLTGHDIPKQHAETAGIQCSTCYWPVKTVDTNKVMLFKLVFWDAGEMACRKFDHILPGRNEEIACQHLHLRIVIICNGFHLLTEQEVLLACTDKLDGILFLFSIVDKASFDELHQQISRLTTSNENVARLVVATKCDQHAHSEVTQRDIREFEKTWKIPVLKIKNILDTTQADVNDTIRFMGTLCEYLWQRDLILAGKLPQEAGSPPLKNQKRLYDDEYI